MEIRKLKIVPEDEARLRELLNTAEFEIDGLSDEELDEAESRTSQQILRLCEASGVRQISKTSRKLRLPIKSGAVAILAAAVTLLYVRLQIPTGSGESGIVSKGIGQGSGQLCDMSVIEADRTTPETDSNGYIVKAGTVSYLKLGCGVKPIVQLGVRLGSGIRLIKRNLALAPDSQVVMDGNIRLDIAGLMSANPELMILVTSENVDADQLPEEDRVILWMDQVPLKIIKD